MEKINIAIGYKAGKTTIIAEGGVQEVLDAYNEAKKDESWDFVGMLRKPRWYKRATPKRSLELTVQRAKAEAERSRLEAEYAKQEEARIEAKLEEMRKQKELEAAKAELKYEDSKKAQARLNEKGAKAEQKERDGKIEEQLENQIAAESDEGLSPSTEELKASAPKKKAARKK